MKSTTENTRDQDHLYNIHNNDPHQLVKNMCLNRLLTFHFKQPQAAPSLNFDDDDDDAIHTFDYIFYKSI